MRSAAGNERRQGRAPAIQEGAQADLNRHDVTSGVVGVILFAGVGFYLGLRTAGGFAVGAILSGLAGFVGHLDGKPASRPGTCGIDRAFALDQRHFERRIEHSGLRVRPQRRGRKQDQATDPKRR